MSGVRGATGKVRFGVFELDRGAAELRKSGIRLRLHDQPYRVLSLLVETPGQLVTREELQKALWPDDTIVDFEHGLNSAIAKLRDMLGDSASHPRYIETIPRRGYRFVGPVESIHPPADAERFGGAGPVEGAESRHGSTRAVWWYRLTAAGIAALAIGVFGGHFLKTSPGLRPVRVIPVTTYAGHEVLPALSPDGRQVAFAWDGEQENNYDIYVKAIGAESAVRLTTDPLMETSPAWSPDGTSIAFIRVRPPETLEIWIISTPGGTAKKVGELRGAGMLDAVAHPAGSDTHKRRRISWAGGEWLATQENPKQTEPSALFLFCVRTGEKRQLTSPPANSGGDRSPTVSADGRRIAFIRGPSGQGSRLAVVDITADHKVKSAPIELTSGDLGAEDPAWTPDGQEIVFSAGTAHNRGLWRVRASGSEGPRRIFEAGDGAIQPAIAADRLVYTHWTLDVNIWKVDTGDGKPGAEEKATRLIASTYIDHMPVFSPDGSRVAFISNRMGAQEVWVANADGSDAARLSSFPDREIFSYAWSPDGKRIVFQVDNGQAAELYVSPADGGPTARLMDARGVEMPAWSHDGRWIYFQQRAGAGMEIRRTSAAAPDITASTLMLKGGRAPTESPDGRFLFFAKGGGLWRMALPAGPEQQVLLSLSYPVNYAVTDRGIFFIPSAEERHENALELLNLTAGNTTVIHRFAAPVAWGLTATRDGRSVLYTRIDSQGGDLKLIEKFH